MTNKQKEALSKFYFNVALLSLGSLGFSVASIEELSLFGILKAVVGLTLMAFFLILGLITLKGLKR